jgi:hypothetical protein
LLWLLCLCSDAILIVTPSDHITSNGQSPFGYGQLNRKGGCGFIVTLGLFLANLKLAMVISRERVTMCLL